MLSDPGSRTKEVSSANTLLCFTRVGTPTAHIPRCGANVYSDCAGLLLRSWLSTFKNLSVIWPWVLRVGGYSHDLRQERNAAKIKQQCVESGL